jgi:hypothetical protein
MLGARRAGRSADTRSQCRARHVSHAIANAMARAHGLSRSPACRAVLGRAMCPTARNLSIFFHVANRHGRLASQRL